MTAESIARVVADLRARRIQTPPDENLAVLSEWGSALFTDLAVGKTPVVDATDIYRSLVDRDDPIDLYGDHTIPPAWDLADICYENQHGNVIVMPTIAYDRKEHSENRSIAAWETAEPIDWTDVRWIMMTLIYVGGRSDTLHEPLPTQGPVFLLEYAVGVHGEPLDLHWVDLLRAAESSDQMPREWDMAMLTHLATLDFLACRNVEPRAVRPTDRSARRRLERTGVVVNELVVRPVGRSSPSRPRTGLAATPLTSVRGHFAHYGDCCPGRHQPKGLAFGKLTGRYWVPQHARGDEIWGDHHNDYRLIT